MSSLATGLRRQLEGAVKQARRTAEVGSRKALEALAVHEAEPYRHMDDIQRALRRKLRAQARQLGDSESQVRRGTYEIRHLIEKLAYDQWHRILFARFLLENGLLISPEHHVPVTLEDCEELAPSLGLRDSWAVAARFAATELPEIFRTDDPAGAVELPVEDRNPLIQLVSRLPVDVFTASDSLGWCYQFWQAERKDQVNASGTKIGADELPAVTQLFTEDYMVDFLLDNTLGAWHAGKVLKARPELATTAQSEEELRNAVALPGVAWSYLRFIRNEGTWTPAAGTFEGWRRTAKELKCLDPCMGSGHFVVAMFERLVALRLAEEGVDDPTAVEEVIRGNLFGLEIDPRCTQIGAFNLALAAWRRVGHRKLPPMNIACSGLAPNSSQANWVALAGDDENLQRGMLRLYQLFKDAPVLGSLINPHAVKGDMLEAGFQELQPLLEKALARESADESTHELGVTARGIAKAAEILADKFTLVATNVPYLGRGKQGDSLKGYCEIVHPEARAELATCFVERGFAICADGGTTAIVSSQYWLFLATFKKLRQKLLSTCRWSLVARLGVGAFETISGEVVNVALVVCTSGVPRVDHEFLGTDASKESSTRAKADSIRTGNLVCVNQKSQLANPGAKVILGAVSDTPPLETVALVCEGLHTGDYPRFGRKFWEVSQIASGWSLQQGGVTSGAFCSGLEHIIFWEEGAGQLIEFVRERLGTEVVTQWIKGDRAWGRDGVAVSTMGDLKPSIFLGALFTHGICAIVPKAASNTTAIRAFVESAEFSAEIRRLDQKVSVARDSIAKVPFNLAHWQEVAKERYPNGPPKPFSSDPTQWLFSGHPKGSDQPLHVAVARLLGYRWPRQTGSSFPDCPALGLDGLEPLADADGIVPLPASQGEGTAAERLRELLARAYGQDWSAAVLEQLLEQVGYAGKTLDDWLHDGYFEQHSALFHHRPFVWHIWDGHRSGFNALVNYHRLDRSNLEKLTYAYLGDWIRRQQAAVDAGQDGSDARLQAAKQLQARLRLILEGEPPFDIFVRWKPLSRQAVGWQPDINDGVRLNIRPLLAEDIPGGKKGAGVLRSKPNIKWEKDRGKEPPRAGKEFPWFWSWDGQKLDFAGVGSEPDGNRWNGCHYTNGFKRQARGG